MKILFSILCLMVLSSCAKRADAIAPIDIPIAAYSNLECDALAQELQKEQNNVAALSKKQNGAAIGDTIGVFLIGVPASSVLGGDQEGALAVSKGRLLSIENTILAKNCNQLAK